MLARAEIESEGMIVQATNGKKQTIAARIDQMACDFYAAQAAEVYDGNGKQ